MSSICQAKVQVHTSTKHTGLEGQTKRKHAMNDTLLLCCCCCWWWWVCGGGCVVVVAGGAAYGGGGGSVVVVVVAGGAADALHTVPALQSGHALCFTMSSLAQS